MKRILMVVGLLCWSGAAGAQIEQKITAWDGVEGDQFGYSVSLDGDTVLISAPLGNDVGTEAAGTVYVFTRSAGTWSGQRKLVSGYPTGYAFFGRAVSLAGDTALVGEPNSDDAGFDSGSAWVFVGSGDDWYIEDWLTASNAAQHDMFGESVAVDGDTALVGAHKGDGVGADTGAAYVFVRDAGEWTEQAKIVATDGVEGDYFGWSVAVDGDTALIGAPDCHGADTGSGAAYVFVRNAGEWTEQAKLTASDATISANLGQSVALHGNTALVGARGDGGDGTGAAYVFVRSGGVWTEQAKLTASDAAPSHQFGWSVAFEGDTLMVGSDDNDVSPGPGAAYAFYGIGLIFMDGFESGDLEEWSSHIP